MTARKPFDRRLYEQNDGKAKKAVLSFLRLHADEAQENPDEYGVDILFCFGGQDWQAEVEIKHGWDGGDFPFDTIHLPQRKLRYIPRERVLYFILSSDLRRALIIPGEAAHRSELVSVPNKYVESDELFCNIPVAAGRIVDLQEGP